MIIGTGNDLVNIDRIDKTIGRYGVRFIDRIFTATEKEKSENRRKRIESYAKRFAAKEACAKALGTGFRDGVFWRDIGVVNLQNGLPTIELTGGAAKRLQNIIPPGMEVEVHLALTDEPPLASATVIISAKPVTQ